ncbi:hypothetical protein Leryth_009725 [Lithospermum erythrorhizon]|nr:hypothetical protein Leryth_009725 [Lithospermum erythrorhizon]
MLDDSMNTTVTEGQPFFPWEQELEFLVQGGVPRNLRGEVWQALVGARSRHVEKYYQDLFKPEGHAGDDQNNVKSTSGSVNEGRINDRVDVPEKWKKQIEKDRRLDFFLEPRWLVLFENVDLPRTFPGHPALNESGKDSLRRLLLAYARHNPSVGHMLYTSNLFMICMVPLTALSLCLSSPKNEKMTEAQVTWITAPWFLSIFVNVLPWESGEYRKRLTQYFTVLRVWDVLLFEGNRVTLFRTALAIMELYGPAVVTTMDAGDAMSLLQTLTASTFDGSQLVLTACMGFNNIPEDKLQGLREKHHPSVLAVLEERDRGDKVSKQSKSIATKLASFKRDPGLILEESKNDEKVPKESKSLATKLASFKHDPGPLIQESKTDKNSGNKPIPNNISASDSDSANHDEFPNDITTDSEVDSIKDLQDQIVWLKIELSELLEEKRSADLRAEELETALMEMVKEDNCRELTAKVLMRLEQEQKATENARIRAEQEAAAQRIAALAFQDKYEKAMASLTEVEKKVVMAKSLLEATSTPPDSQRRTSLFSLSLNWCDKSKGNSSNMASTDDSKTTSQVSQTSSSATESNGHQERSSS